MNPTIIIATHQRLEITTNLINDLLKNQVKTNIVIGASLPNEIKHYQKIESDQVKVITTPNKPLGLKWQQCANYARTIKADPLIILGSDDMLSPDFVANACNKIKQGFHFIGLKRFYVLHSKKKYTIDYKPAMPIGGGRVYSAELLDSINWKVFNPSKNRHLDDDGWQNVLKSGKKILLIQDIKHHGLELTALKGNWAMMNPFNKYHPNISIVCVE